MYVSFYRRYRPQSFSDVVGQGVAVELLRLSLAASRMSHAYLFSGPRGCGKTTVARLLAKALNCNNPAEDGEPCCECSSCLAVASGEHLDVMEIDGASNRGIDQIRELRSHVSLAPFMSDYKIYILDEVHMLTTEAFNALLKTLEEPPPSVIFIFATTEPHKVPVTVRSRCQHVAFHRISPGDIAKRLREIAVLEGFEAEDGAIWEIARASDGALRDALSLCEQALPLGGGALTREATRRFFGGGSRCELEEWMRLVRNDPAKAAPYLRELLDRGVSPERFLDALFVLLRDMWVYALWGEEALGALSLSSEERDYLAAEAPGWGASRLRELCGSLSRLFTRVRWGLSADVFTGLLLCSFLGRDEAVPGLKAVTQTERSAVPEWQELPFPEETPFHPAPRNETRAKHREAALPEIDTPPPPYVRDASVKLHPALEALWREDLPLCAAILEAELHVRDGELVIDEAHSAQPAVKLLNSPRARQALELAFGVKAREAPDASEEEQTRGFPPLPEIPSRRESDSMTPEDLAVLLGAQILMERPLEDGVSNEEDENEEEIDEGQRR